MDLCLQSGMTVQEDCAGSDVVVVNTCGFIDSAKLEAIETILSVAELKAAGRVGKILVTGCLSQRYQAELLEELPEVDGIMGTGSYGDIVSAVEQVAAGQKFSRFADISGPVEELPPGHLHPHALCLPAHCRGVQQPLRLLHYPGPAGQVPQPPDGGYPHRGQGPL